ncbi:MAG: endolytic transglycosylase MltG [Solirubrobacterales bacterium]
MNEQGEGTRDPFDEGDEEATERERRRREREQRRRQEGERDRSQGTRRSLGELVAGRRPGRRSPTGSEPAVPVPARQDPGPSVGPPERAAATPSPPPDSAAPATQEPGAPAPPRSEIITRRLLAGGAVLAAIVVIVVLAKLAGGGDEQPTVAAPPPLKTTDVTVPEGLTIDQIAGVAKKAKLKGSYVKAANKALKKFPLKRYDAEGADSLEGFLFPATYELEKNAPAADLVAKQLEAFEQNYAGVDEKQAKKKNLTSYDVLTIASMIEKEVQVADERPTVAAVIYNRLAAGDTLGIDATLRYELQNYDEQLLQSELDAPTPYNTRINPGLPPTPISNPGLASIEAAANPAKTDAYFFVIKPGTCGEHVFTANAAKFEAAQAAYQQALAEQGGSPTDCPG